MIDSELASILSTIPPISFTTNFANRSAYGILTPTRTTLTAFLANHRGSSDEWFVLWRGCAGLRFLEGLIRADTF